MDVGVRPSRTLHRPRARGPRLDVDPSAREPTPTEPTPTEPTPADPASAPPASVSPAPPFVPVTPSDDPPERRPIRDPALAVPPRRSRRTALVAVLLGLATLAGTGWVLLVGLGGAPAVSPAEGLFAVRSFAVNRFGFSAAHLA